MEYEKAIHQTDAVLSMEWIDLPVGVTEWILEESSDVFERSPLLCIVSWLLHCVDKLAEVSISGFHQRSKVKQSYNQISNLAFWQHSRLKFTC